MKLNYSILDSWFLGYDSCGCPLYELKMIFSTKQGRDETRVFVRFINDQPYAQLDRCNYAKIEKLMEPGTETYSGVMRFIEGRVRNYFGFDKDKRTDLNKLLYFTNEPWKGGSNDGN